MKLELADNNIGSRALVNEPAELSGWFSHFVHQITHAASQAAGAVKKAEQDVVKGAKTILLAPAREAMRVLVSHNVMNMASQLYDAITEHPDKIRSKWENIGGKFSSLKDAVNKGSNKAHLNEGGQDLIYDFRDGSAGAADPNKMQDFMKIAAPIINAILPLIKSLFPKHAKKIDETIDLTKQLNPEGAVDPTTKPEKFDFQHELSGIPKPLIYGGIALAAILLLKNLKK